MVWGDTTTNVLTGSTWSNIYRVLDTTLTDSQRPIMASMVTVNTFAAAGTYWLDWQSDGTLASGPWAPPVTILGQTTTGNANQYTAHGALALDLERASSRACRSSSRARRRTATRRPTFRG